jgi:hypothetical protein
MSTPEDSTAPLPEQEPTAAAAPAGESRWRRVRTRSAKVAKHRVTLLIAALALGGAIGSGITAAFVDGDDERGGGDNRGHSESHQDHGERHQDHGGEQDGHEHGGRG